MSSTANKRKLVVNVNIDTVRIIYNEDNYASAAILELDGVPMVDIDIASNSITVSDNLFRAEKITSVDVNGSQRRFVTLDALLQQIKYRSLGDDSWAPVTLYLNIAQYWNQLMVMESRISIHHFIICVASMTRHHSLSNH